MSQGEFKKRILKMQNAMDTSLASDYEKTLIRMHTVGILELLDEARKGFPLNPIIEAVNLYDNLRNHTEEEKSIIIKEHLKNCNLERFTLETIEWFLKWLRDTEKLTDDPWSYEAMTKRIKEGYPATGDGKFEEEIDVKKLLSWTPSYPDMKNVFNKKNEMYERGDEKAPFFSEAYLYNLLGKEDARTLLALMRRAFGVGI